jgi:hypothetical protein
MGNCEGVEAGRSKARALFECRRWFGAGHIDFTAILSVFTLIENKTNNSGRISQELLLTQAGIRRQDKSAY